MLAQDALNGRARHAEQAGELGRGALARFRLGDDFGALGGGKAWSPSKVPAGFAGVRESVHGSLADHGALKLGECAKHLRHQPARRGGGVYRLSQRSETGTDCGNRLQREQKIAEGSGQPVELPHHQAPVHYSDTDSR